MKELRLMNSGSKGANFSSEELFLRNEILTGLDNFIERVLAAGDSLIYDEYLLGSLISVVKN